MLRTIAVDADVFGFGLLSKPGADDYGSWLQTRQSRAKRGRIQRIRGYRLDAVEVSWRPPG
jgi:hypothetical protein